MNLDSFLGRSEATPRRESDGRTATALPEDGFVQGGGKASVLEPHADPSSVTTAPSSGSTVVSRDVTPNGTELTYRPEQWIDGKKIKRQYTVNGVVVPSVTTVLDILKADGLVWWGQSKGVQGVIDLFDLGVLCSAVDWTTDKEGIAITQGEDVIPADEAAITELLKEHKLTVNHRLDQASERGVNVHDALEQWAKTGQLPSPGDFPESESGYVEGLLNFIAGPEIKPLRYEIMVGSVEYGFAGRFDLVIEITEPVSLVTKCYPKRADKRIEVLPGCYLCDLKTSKGVYAKHFLQLAAYELAAVECGYPATDGQAVIHVTADGKYELVFSDAPPEAFLAVKSAYDALEKL